MDSQSPNKPTRTCPSGCTDRLLGGGWRGWRRGGICSGKRIGYNNSASGRRPLTRPESRAGGPLGAWPGLHLPVTRWRQRSLLPQWGGGGTGLLRGSVLPPLLFRQALAGAPPTPGGREEGGAPREHRPLRRRGTCRHAQACGHQQGLRTPLPVPCPRLVPRPGPWASKEAAGEGRRGRGLGGRPLTVQPWAAPGLRSHVCATGFARPA